MTFYKFEHVKIKINLNMWIKLILRFFLFMYYWSILHFICRESFSIKTKLQQNINVYSINNLNLNILLVKMYKSIHTMHNRSVKDKFKIRIIFHIISFEAFIYSSVAFYNFKSHNLFSWTIYKLKLECPYKN